MFILTAYFDRIVTVIDVCNYIFQPKTTINNVWKKMRRLCSASAKMSQTCPMWEDEHKFPSPNPADSFFVDVFGHMNLPVIRSIIQSLEVQGKVYHIYHWCRYKREENGGRSNNDGKKGSRVCRCILQNAGRLRQHPGVHWTSYWYLFQGCDPCLSQCSMSGTGGS